MDERQTLIEAVGEQLRAKIMSKFQTSAFLAGLAVAVLGVQLSDLAGSTKPPLFAVSIALMFGAVLLYVAALVRLDELTMPKRFWRKDPALPVGNYHAVLLEDAELVELQRCMVFHWYKLTLTATVITGVALLLLLIPPSWAAAALVMSAEGAFVSVIVSLVMGFFYLCLLSQINRKRSKNNLELID
jgi:hypothetical protein